MNEKIQAILLQVVVEMKRLYWTASPDWELTLKSEGQVPLVKNISVEGQIDDNEVKEMIQTHIELTLQSDDEITYYPQYAIYAQIFLDGGVDKDVVYKLDADIAFTQNDLQDKAKMASCAAKINHLVEDHIQHEFDQYLNHNSSEIIAYKQSGDMKADNEEDL